MPVTAAARPHLGSGGPGGETAGLGLLASAVAGRPLEVSLEEGAGPGWTDGATVFVPADAGPSERRAVAVVQAALMCAGSFDPGIVRALRRQPDLARRYLMVEAHRALTANPFLPPRLAGRLIDREAVPRTTSPLESMHVARSRVQVPPPPAVFGQIRPDRWRAEPPGPAAREGAAPPRPSSQRGSDLEELSDDGDEDRGDDGFPVSPVGGGGALGRLLKKLLREGRSGAGGPAGADAPTHRGRRIAPRPGVVTVLAGRDSPLDAGTHAGLAVEEGRFDHPEWDMHRRSYRPRWCTVVESDPPADATAPFATPDTAPLRRALARLGTDLERWRRQRQGDDIDIDAAVEALVEARAGSAPDPDVYIDSLRRRRELAVMVLLDISGSAGEPSSTGVAVHEHQRRAAAALTGALHDLGDRVALYGFRSQGRGRVEFLRVKSFDDPLDGRALHRLASLTPGAYTRLGAAIRHGAVVLGRRAGTTQRVLVVISDGFAYDHGYERAYGEADSRRALREARRAGIGCLCLSVGAATDTAALRRVFGTAAHAAIPRPDQLASVIGPLFVAALRSADRQRREHQTRTRAADRLAIERRAG